LEKDDFCSKEFQQYFCRQDKDQVNRRGQKTPKGEKDEGGELRDGTKMDKKITTERLPRECREGTRRKRDFVPPEKVHFAHMHTLEAMQVWCEGGRVRTGLKRAFQKKDSKVPDPHSQAYLIVGDAKTGGGQETTGKNAERTKNRFGRV